MRFPARSTTTVTTAAAAAVLAVLAAPPAPAATADDGSGLTDPAAAQAAVTVDQGSLASGGRYLVELPASWNGTLLVWSPGYGAGGGTAATNTPNATARSWLLDHGYALAGTSPKGTGWAVAEIVPDAAAVVRHVAERFGTPRTTIAWGASMGGQATAGVVQNHPDLFDGALPLCGSVAGPVAMLNAGLDASWAMKQLLAPSAALPLVRVTDESARQAAARAILEPAQQSAAGRARIALAASFGQFSTWSVASAAKPGPTDYEAQEQQQYAGFVGAAFSPRQPLEQRAGGNFSWNTGVDYADLLARSGTAEQVAALYARAGLDLDRDLATLAAAPRIAADPAAVEYMARNITPTGEISDPVLTLSETGDNAPTLPQASAYAAAVAAKGNAALLRQAFVDRPGHCGYQPAEVLAAVVTLEQRIRTGQWGATDAASLNRLAADLASASSLPLGSAGFAAVTPPPMLRPYLPGTPPTP